jgi:ATP-dependent protease ClpP protease subunit
VKESYKYIDNISKEKGTIKLYGEIGKVVNAHDFTAELKTLQNECNTIDVHINSFGGSVLDGYAIISEILNSEKPVNTVVVGLAASIAGVIAMAGKKRSIMDYASWMGHEASSPDQKISDLATDTLVTFLSNNTKKDKEQIMAMLKKETWISDSRVSDYSLQQAKDMGFFDEIISTKRKLSVPTNLMDMALLYNKILTEQPMEENKNELQELKNKVTELTESNRVLQTKLTDAEARELDLKNKAEAEAKTRAEALVNKAVKDGKLKEEEKAEYITAATSNFSFVENALEKISNVKPAAKVFDFTKVSNKKGSAEDRSDWTIRDWEKKDHKGLLEIKNSTPELYDEMYNAFYKQK